MLRLCSSDQESSKLAVSVFCGKMRTLLSVLLVLGLCALHAHAIDLSDDGVMTPATAVKIIQKSIFPEDRSERLSRSMCSRYTCCNITATNQCLLKDLTNPEFTLVLPGGKTRCIFQDSSPFAFQVFPGDIDKILFYFQGGGACFNKFSTDLDLCTPDCLPQAPVGIFDRANPNNQYRNFTMFVFFALLFCFLQTNIIFYLFIFLI